MTAVNQKEYLKKYLGIGKSDGTKKKRKKTKKALGKRLKIIDDDIDVALSEEIKQDLAENNEEAPQIVEVIDDRPPSLRFDEKTKSKLWVPMGATEETVVDEKLTFNSSPVRTIKREPSADISPVRIKSEYSPRRAELSPLQRRNSEDYSPKRRRNSNSSDQSPRRQRNADADYSPKRRKKHDVDNSPKRRRNVGSDDQSPRRQKRGASDYSPRRRRNSDSGDQSPKRQRNSDFRDQSPRRQKRDGTDFSPRRRKNSDSGDQSPKRQRNSDFRDQSPKRQKRGDTDYSPKRRRNSDSRDQSPKRPRNNASGDQSPVRKKSSVSDQSPKRRNHSHIHREETRKNSSRQRTSRWGENSPEHSKTTNKREENLVCSKKSGLQNAQELNQELGSLREQEREMFAKMSAEISGKNAVTVSRKKPATDPETDLEKQRRQRELDEKYSRWGKGLKQVEDSGEKLAQELHEMSKPLARYADDEDLERYLKEQEREGDPMLMYMRKKKRQKAVEAGVQDKPVYMGDFMPNRYGIRPGYRWDGVDRSNGYEQKLFHTKNSEKAARDEAFMWNTEDM